MKTLTNKRANFARFLFLGLNEHDAYLKAGFSSKQKDATINSHACVLSKNAYVVARIQELQRKADDASIMDVKERKQVLTFLARMKGYKGVAAIAELNKMDGAYAPVKQDITSKGNELKPARIYNIIVPETKLLLEKLEHEGRLEPNSDFSPEPKQLSEPAIPTLS